MVLVSKTEMFYSSISSGVCVVLMFDFRVVVCVQASLIGLRHPKQDSDVSTLDNPPMKFDVSSIFAFGLGRKNDLVLLIFN